MHRFSSPPNSSFPEFDPVERITTVEGAEATGRRLQELTNLLAVYSGRGKNGLHQRLRLPGALVYELRDRKTRMIDEIREATDKKVIPKDHWLIDFCCPGHRWENPTPVRDFAPK